MFQQNTAFENPPCSFGTTPAARFQGSDALTDRRALCERSELARPPIVCIRPILMRPGGASMVLGPFAETKGPRLPGRTPALPAGDHPISQHLKPQRLDPPRAVFLGDRRVRLIGLTARYPNATPRLSQVRSMKLRLRSLPYATMRGRDHEHDGT